MKSRGLEVVDRVRSLLLLMRGSLFTEISNHPLGDMIVRQMFIRSGSVTSMLAVSETEFIRWFGNQKLRSQQ